LDINPSHHSGVKKNLLRIASRFIHLWNYWAEAIPTYRYILRHADNIDLIHVFGKVNVTSAAITYSKIMKKPVIVELVNLTSNPNYYEPFLVSKIYGNGYPKKSIIVCISNYLRDICINYGYKQEQIWCRLNPVDSKIFNYDRNSMLQYRNIVSKFSRSDIVILQLAKFMPLKNQLFILDVLTRLPANYKLILAGPIVSSGPLVNRDEEYYSKILSFIKSNNLSSRVEINVGFINNPEIYMKASDVFVLPSIKEALGTPVLESLSCGVPVVVNKIDGVFDSFVKNGKNGYICKLDSELWAQKIVSASKIDNEIMKDSSYVIMQISSTDFIDDKYMKLINKLTG